MMRPATTLADALRVALWIVLLSGAGCAADTVPEAEVPADIAGVALGPDGSGTDAGPDGAAPGSDADVVVGPSEVTAGGDSPDSGATADLADVPAPAPLDWSVVVDGDPQGALLSMWARAADDVWFVGGQLHAPRVLHLGPSGWQAHDPGTGQQAWWVHGFEGGEVVVVGDGGSVARYDGVGWQEEATGVAGATLYGVWGDGPESLWAVGGPFLLGEEPAASDVLLRFEGGAWQQVALPEVGEDRAGQSLFKVWGSAADDVYVVGSDGMILRWDGVVWAREVVEGLESVSLFTVVGRSADDVWAVGGGPRGVLLRRDAAGWAEVELPQFTPQLLQGLWTAPGRPIYVGGAYGYTARLDAGGWWLPDPVTPNVLHALHGDPGGGLWAAGGSIMALSPSYSGTLLVAGREAPALEVAPPDAGPDARASDASDGAAQDAVERVDVGPEVDEVDSGGGDEVGCGPPDLACPEDTKPYPGAPCEGALSCDYENGTHSVDHFQCEGGAWSWSTECLVTGCTALPPISEWCATPFGGHLPSEGVVVTLGPAVEGAPYVPFEPGEVVPTVWGGQGMPMVALRMGITGADEVDCVEMQVTATLSGIDLDASMWVTVRCGATLRIYLILPVSVLDCAEGELFDLELAALVNGVGTGAASIMVEGGGAPWCD